MLVVNNGQSIELSPSGEWNLPTDPAMRDFGVLNPHDLTKKMNNSGQREIVLSEMAKIALKH